MRLNDLARSMLVGPSPYHGHLHRNSGWNKDPCQAATDEVPDDEIIATAEEVVERRVPPVSLPHPDPSGRLSSR